MSEDFYKMTKFPEIEQKNYTSLTIYDVDFMRKPSENDGSLL